MPKLSKNFPKNFQKSFKKGKATASRLVHFNHHVHQNSWYSEGRKAELTMAAPRNFEHAEVALQSCSKR